MDKRNNNLKKAYMLIVAILFILWLGLLLTFLSSSFMQGGGYLDRSVSSFAYKNRTEILNSVFIFITSWGNTVPVIIITGLLSTILFICKKRFEAFFYSGHVLGVFIFNELLKFIIKRPRPNSAKLVKALGYSFPSGHAMISMGAALLLIYFILSFVRNKNIAVPVSIAIFMFAFLIGISRVYVGVHYPSDVVGGWMFASAYTLLGILAYENLIKRMEV
jgi:undecaprenyl-diphosphatase